jgi:hypothetical protein
MDEIVKVSEVPAIGSNIRISIGISISAGISIGISISAGISIGIVVLAIGPSEDFAYKFAKAHTTTSNKKK